MVPSLTETIEANNKALEASVLGFAASEIVHIPPASATVWIKRQPARNELTGCMIQRSYIEG